MITWEAERATLATTSRRIAAAHGASDVPTRVAWLLACGGSVAVPWTVGGNTAARAALALTGLLLATAALVDVHEHRLPNRLLLGAFLAALLAAVARGELLVALPGTAVAGGLLLLVRLRRGVGMGDVKMAAVVGLGVASGGGQAAPLAIAIAALAAGLFGLARRRTRLPLGPALWLGWCGALAAQVGGWAR